ncbi:hypothetical protein SAMN05444359_12685, partial [Neolewinella agarilytica]
EELVIVYLFSHLLIVSLKKLNHDLLE